MAKYTCSNNSAHTVDAMTADGFCEQPECYGVGFLTDGQNQPTGSLPTTPTREIGLCVLLMDASSSMKEVAFSTTDNPAKKDQLIAGCAAGGIFELQQLSNTEDAYIIVVGFDHEQRVILTTSLAELFAKHKTQGDFARFLASSFTYGSTDINGALRYAKGIYDAFTKTGDLSKYGGGPRNVKPIMQTIMTKDLESKVVPNIRVLMYTDGEETVSSDISGNPFSAEETDVLLGAYFGKGEEKGCQQLKRILSKCPIHQVDQFFLINAQDRIQTLKKLFRMASGASGFCPVCLAHD
jgi:hypothetical protein